MTESSDSHAGRLCTQLKQPDRIKTETPFQGRINLNKIRLPPFYLNHKFLVILSLISTHSDLVKGMIWWNELKTWVVLQLLNIEFDEKSLWHIDMPNWKRWRWKKFLVWTCGAFVNRIIKSFEADTFANSPSSLGAQLD